MSTFFSRIILATIITIGGVVAASSQETAALPDVTALTYQPIVATCATGAGAEGTCVNPTQAYMTALVAQALPTEQFSQTLANYVIELAAIAQADDACTFVDKEISEAIALAASFAIDPAQREQLAGIGETIGSCGDFQTAAIAPVASPN